MSGTSGVANESGVAVDIAGRKICGYIQECTVTGAGLCFGGGISVGGQQGGLESGTAEQGGVTIMGGRGIASELQYTIDKDGNIGGTKGLIGVGAGAGGGLISCRTGYRCWNF